MSHPCKPWKFPWMTWCPVNVRSELRYVKSPGSVSFMNCAGFGAAATSRRFQAAWAAFISPARRPTRGSGLGGGLDGAPWPLLVETATANRPAASKRDLDLIEDSVERFSE